MAASASLPDLSKSLQGRDLGHLQIVAELWGLELNAPDARAGLKALVPAMLDASLVEETIETLQPGAVEALIDLYTHQGRLPWALFTRRYGGVREMGPARRDRERPHRTTEAPAEMLWYRALVARAFFDTPNGPEEFAYIPQDLMALIPAPQMENRPPLGRPATPLESAHAIPVHDRILDHACTLLAALRMGLPEENIEAAAASWRTPIGAAVLNRPALEGLLAAAGLIGAGRLPLPEPTRNFLQADRGEALALLARAWERSPHFDELRLLPGLVFEGDWKNDPLRARRAVLDFLSTVDSGQWWSLAAFVDDARQYYPDFQRPAGDYDSWFIRAAEQGEFLRGFEHWDRIDGALIRYLITGPLHWLGILELAAPAEDEPPAAFRFSSWAGDLQRGDAPRGLDEETELINVRSDARIWVPRLAPRAARYQLARFSEWEADKDDGFHYRLTPESLDRARQQGLRLEHLFALLRHHGRGAPASLLKALKNWQAAGVQARLERVVVLRVSSPEIMQALRNSKAARFLGDPLGPTTIIVHAEAWEKVLAALAEMGYLGSARFDT